MTTIQIRPINTEYQQTFAICEPNSVREAVDRLDCRLAKVEYNTCNNSCSELKFAKKEETRRLEWMINSKTDEFHNIINSLIEEIEILKEKEKNKMSMKDKCEEIIQIWGKGKQDKIIEEFNAKEDAIVEEDNIRKVLISMKEEIRSYYPEDIQESVDVRIIAPITLTKETNEKIKELNEERANALEELQAKANKIRAVLKMVEDDADKAKEMLVSYGVIDDQWQIL